MISASEAQRLFGRIGANISGVMQGQQASIRKLLAAFAAGGHVLIEDTPGTGKTTLAKALAASIGAPFTRVQFTPDLLPSDILGVSIFNQRDQQFEFRPGPVFTSILLADEVNRASPRTQSALLEVMAEGQASIEGRTRAMDELFFVIATQNPVEFRGTYPRTAPQVLLGCGPRASIALTQAAKALALFDGEEFVRPEHVKELAAPVLAHRMVLDPQAKFAGTTGATLVAESRRFPGRDSEFYDVERAAAKTGLARATDESLSSWMERHGLREKLGTALALHYRYRFDPEGLSAPERAALRSTCLAIIAAWDRS